MKYIAWEDVQKGYETFTWDPLDEFLRDASNRGHHAIFRIYADYPNKPYGVPDFLSKVRKRPYRDFSNGVDATSYSPDYGNKDLLWAMVNTIRALGERYDGDARIRQISLLWASSVSGVSGTLSGPMAANATRGCPLRRSSDKFSTSLTRRSTIPKFWSGTRTLAGGGRPWASTTTHLDKTPSIRRRGSS